MSIKGYIKVIKDEIRMLPRGISFLLNSKKKAIYVGCTDMDNLGDEAIYDAIESMLKTKIALYKLSYKKPSAGKIFRKYFIENPDYIVLGGGTIIRKAKNESYLKLLYHFKGRYPNAKVITLGPGVADPEFANEIGFPIDIPSWKEILKDSPFISVRGILSKKEIQSWGISNVDILHDPGVYYTRQNLKRKKKNKTIGINFCNIGDRIHGADKSVVEKFAFNFVQRLINDNWNIYLYPTTKSDLNYMLNTISLKKFSELRSYENYERISEAIDFLEGLDVFAGQRLHAMIFSAAAHTPFHAFEYEPKTSDFLNTIGFYNYSTKVNQLDVENIIHKIDGLYDNLDDEQLNLFNALTLAKKEQSDCLTSFLNTV
ncbi:hypothetical protein GCM10009117_03750 [Gangjinia marincola]|uniref:Polysaccharide pyruvyl transferase domain-containing protein n=1 Tax=Gangjinia marincola TaxID=578463 RepID=A0ABP3XSA2_9FLAO